MQAAYNMFFMRHEQKYLLKNGEDTALWELIEPYFTADGYGQSTVCNLYYDTDNYDLIRASIEHPVYKEKLRLRSYNIPGGDTNVFLEIKKKYKGVVYKRRVFLPLEEAIKCLEQRHIEPIEGQEQICAEINYFLQHYQLSPAVFLAYDRDAFYATDNPDLRITFDRNLRSRNDQLSLAEGDAGNTFFENDEVLMEIKTTGAYPFWLIHALEECSIRPVSFSKYGNIYKQYLLPDFIKKLSANKEGEINYV